MIVLMAGLPGTGKSTLAQALANRLSGSILSKDEIRHTLFAARDVEYSTRQDDFVTEIMLRAAEWIVKADPTRVVFLDGRTFSKRYQIDRVLQLCEKLGQTWRILECVCSESSARERLSVEMNVSQHPAGNRDFALYLDVKARFESITFSKVEIDTDRPLEECIRQALQALQ